VNLVTDLYLHATRAGRSRLNQNKVPVNPTKPVTPMNGLELF